MAKREKIIIGLMLLVVLYGVYDFLLASPPRKGPAAPAKTAADAKDLADKIRASLDKEGPTSSESAILRLAAAEWAGDPFLGKPLLAAGQPADASQIAGRDIVYSGYIDAGKTKLAIVNGFEYQVGEELESGSLVVRSIVPDRVVLEDKGSHAKIVVPFSGEKF